MWLGEAFRVHPDVAQTGLFPAICLKNAKVLVNFGATPFRFGLPQGSMPILVAPAAHIIDAPAATAAATQKGGPLCIVLEPTRELAEQTHTAFEGFTKYLPEPQVRFALLVGGLSVEPQQAALRKGAHIVTGTPGRLDAFINDGQLSLANVRFLVLDEADNLAENNLDTIRLVYSRVPKSRLQVLMFSATLHSDAIRSLSESICRFPTWVDLKGKDAVPATVDHAFCIVEPSKPIKSPMTTLRIATDGVHRPPLATPEEQASEAIKVTKAQVLLKVIEAHKMSSAIIFCRTKIDCDNLEAFLNAFGGGGRRGFVEHEYSCVVVHGDRMQQERQANLQKFKEGEARFLVTTDVGARGIDISEVPFVINYTLPDKPEDYIHRVGRVGRADRMGLAISLVGARPEKVWFHRCPSRGRSCQNRLLLEQGGCTIWYDEPAFW
jgi:ATP-dependent RNA helicase DDX1